jgi:UTP--glucose-1-phosphate uridylyltransferase
LVEKPKQEEAPSKNAIIGRYILTPRIFDVLEKTPLGAGGELQLTDGIRACCSTKKSTGTVSTGCASMPATSWAC